MLAPKIDWQALANAVTVEAQAIEAEWQWIESID
jgi:hypothetical protein